MKLEIISKHPVERQHPTPLLFIHGMAGLVREAFYSSDLPDDRLNEYWRQCQDESYRAFLDMVALDLPRARKLDTPLLVLGAARDSMLSESEIRATAKAYGTPCEIIPDVAHNSMLELRWQAVANRILAWLGATIPPAVQEAP